MSRRRFLPVLPRLAVLLALSACGGGDDSGDPSDIGTLAYVVTECRDTPEGFFARQALHILHGERDVTVVETPGVGPGFTGVGGLCRAFTNSHNGDGFVVLGALQGVAVSADGAVVVFEVSDDFSGFPELPLHLRPEQKGIFFVRADGSGLRPLAPPSRLPFFVGVGGGVFNLGSFAFSPDSRTITFADKGSDAAGNEAGQVFTLDVDRGQRRQVTDLPPGVPPAHLPSDIASVLSPVFIDNQTIGFFTDADPDFAHKFVPYTVRSDGSEDPKAASVPVTSPDSQILPIFMITGKPTAFVLSRPGQPEKPGVLGQTTIREVFVIDGKNLLQLTDFHRVDTFDAIVDVDGQTVFFTASANPPELHDSNPSETCQIFSIDRNGGNLRQLTRFSEKGGRPSMNGCIFNPLPGCATQMQGQDSRTGTLVFESSCDPLGTNPSGTEVFAMRPDGSLRQLTHTRGVAPRLTELGGTVIGELPGPIAYGPSKGGAARVTRDSP